VIAWFLAGVWVGLLLACLIAYVAFLLPVRKD
jgi:hypothetical protein